jgi:hypothetical protein
MAYYNAETKKIIIQNVKKSTSFSLFNVAGKLLDSFTVDNAYNEINVSTLPEGIYVLKAYSGKAQKMVIY